MKWFKYIAFILALLFVIGWDDGSPAEDPAVGSLIEEQKVILIDWSNVSVVKIWLATYESVNRDRTILKPRLITAGHRFTGIGIFPLIPYADSIYIDSITILCVTDANFADDDTLFFRLDTLKTISGADVGHRYEVWKTDTIASATANTPFTVKIGDIVLTDENKNSEYSFALWVPHTLGNYVNFGRIAVYGTWFYEVKW